MIEYMVAYFDNNNYILYSSVSTTTNFYSSNFDSVEHKLAY